MSGGIPESDWKVFRELRPVWLERYCQRLNSKVASRLSDERLSAHKRYLNVYRLIDRKDRELGDAFNDMRRSTAVIQIRIIHTLGVITDNELARFSDSTRAYQGAAGGLDRRFLDGLEQLSLAGLMPDLTLILDLPAETGLARAAPMGPMKGMPERVSAADAATMPTTSGSFSRSCERTVTTTWVSLR